MFLTLLSDFLVLSGRKLDMLSEMMAQQEGKKKTEQELDWGSGLVQKREREEAARRLQEEASKPLAIYADNAERDSALRSVDRWGDPMLDYLRVRK